MNIEDYKLEIKLLQKKDTEDAIKSGFSNKKEWHDYIINAENDETARAIIDVAERYNLPVTTVALNFDASMISRVKKLFLKGKEKNI